MDLLYDFTLPIRFSHSHGQFMRSFKQRVEVIIKTAYFAKLSITEKKEVRSW